MALSYRNIVLGPKHWKKVNKMIRESDKYKGSYRGLPAKQVGFLGEVVIEEFFTTAKIKWKGVKNAFCDYLITVTDGTTTVDVKTKDRRVPPKKYYANSISVKQLDYQRPDYYYFVSLLRKPSKTRSVSRFTHAFIVGGIDITTALNKGTYMKKGTVSENGSRCVADCINVSMELLYDNDRMIEIFS